MLDFRFLEKDEIFYCDQLEILHYFGTKAVATDFAILQGGIVSNRFYYHSQKNQNRTCKWWTKTLIKDKDMMMIVTYDGNPIEAFPTSAMVGARPAITYSDLTDKFPINHSIKSSDNKNQITIIDDVLLDINIVTFGEYPQMIANRDDALLLDEAYKQGNLKTTGKKYYYCMNCSDNVVEYPEYEANGKKYVHVAPTKEFIYQKNYHGNIELSDGTSVNENDEYWIEVQPITWLVDKTSNIALSEKILFAGVAFNNAAIDDFSLTNIKKFMDNYFSQDILIDNIEERVMYNIDTNIKNKMNSINIENLYDFNYDEVSEEEIIRGMIESNISVFLHGKSSEGKSARIKELDPDCEIIYMRNATPDSLNGKSVYNQATGEMIDIAPSWYLKLKEKCENEPNKIHLVFFDELTNALPSIQGMAFNIILDKEINGKWKLPDNARIVAAGNDLDDSLAANEMAEPLFNRFAHVYIETNVENWLQWAITPVTDYERLDYKKEPEQDKIHPAIYAFIAYGGDAVLRTKYTGIKPNADPRKWEMASKVLYKTKKPKMLRSLLGEGITEKFIYFIKQKVITLDDVINDKITPQHIAFIATMDLSERCATAIGLSRVNNEHLEKVRNYVKKLGSEPLALFDTLWSKGNQERLEIIAELKIKELESEREETKIKDNVSTSNEFKIKKKNLIRDNPNQIYYG